MELKAQWLVPRRSLVHSIATLSRRTSGLTVTVKWIGLFKFELSARVTVTVPVAAHSTCKLGREHGPMALALDWQVRLQYHPAEI